MTTQIYTRQTENVGGEDRSVVVTNGAGGVGLTINHVGGRSVGATVEALALDPDQARKLGRALLCGALNVVDNIWGGETDDDERAIEALGTSRF